jgi:hypothetical protein
MEVHLEALLELDFCTKPPNFGVQAHMESLVGVALTTHNRTHTDGGRAHSWGCPSASF